MVVVLAVVVVVVVVGLSFVNLFGLHVLTFVCRSNECNVQANSQSMLAILI